MFQPKPLPRTLPAALRDVQDKKAHVRRSALADLVRLADGDSRRDAIGALCSALCEDESPELRAAAAVALSDAGATEALDQLVVAFADAHLNVRQMALLAIGELSPPGHASSRRAIEMGLRAEASALRFQALIAGQRAELPKWHEALIAAFTDRDARVRYLALRLADERLARGDELAAAVRSALERGAVTALEDGDPHVRVAAAMVLAPLGAEGTASARAASKRVGEILVDALNGRLTFSEPADEQTLIELAGELGLVAAVPGLRRIARGAFGLVPGRFAWQARVALARLGDVRAREEIRRGLRSRLRDTRTLAVAAAGQARLRELESELVELGRSGAADVETVDEALRLIRDATQIAPSD